MSSAKRILLGAVGLYLGACLSWVAADGLHRAWRLAMNPHQQARIENTWTTTGRYGGRWADLSFANPTGAGACLVKGVQLGGAGLEAEIGDSVEIAAIPGSCAPPELPSQARPNFVHVIQLGIGLALLALGLGRIVDLPLPGVRLSA